MQTSSSSWSYHRLFAAGRMDLFRFVEECASLGLHGVELLSNHFVSTERDYLRSLKLACVRRHLTIAMVSAGGHLTVSDDATREAEVAELERWFDVAAFMGAPRLRFFCGRGDELAAGGEALYARVLDAMQRIVAFGEARGIVAALENHGGTTVEDLLRFRRDIASPWFAFTLDTGNFPPASRVGPNTYACIERAAPHAAIVHAKFFDVLPDGRDRDFDWERIRGILRDSGFRGFLSIEYEGRDPDEMSVMKRISGYLRELVGR